MDELVNIPALGIVCVNMRITNVRASFGYWCFARQKRSPRTTLICVEVVPRKVLAR